MTEQVLTTNKVVVEFPNYEFIEPAELITLSKEYKNRKAEIIDVLRKNKGRLMSIFIARMQHAGMWGKKKITGTVYSVSDNQFTFITNEDYYSKYENNIELIINFENILGNVPLLLSMEEVIPFKFGKKFDGYLKFKREIRCLLKKEVGVAHSAILYFRYGKDNFLRREGNFHIECEILKVNRSNVEIRHSKSLAFINKNNHYLVTGEYEMVKNFVSLDCYLWKVVISPGIKSLSNSFDEN